MHTDLPSFFSAALTAGALLTGFCGTFLSFRIQREAAYYRQPVLDYQSGKAKDVLLKLAHFTSSFLLLIVATLLSIIFGFLLPLFALAGTQWIVSRPEVVVGGLVTAIVFLVAYFTDELVHYRILKWDLRNDIHEWGRERLLVVLASLVAVLAGGFAWLLL
jgi:hypothetical protein